MAEPSTEPLLEILKALKPELETRFKVKSIGIFGSFVRGEQHQTSDVDVLVEFEEGADLFDLTGLALFLEEAFQRKVDVVPRGALRKELQATVLHEVQSV
ncbi:MAG: nucleotidyltransferase family protein [Thermodesulfobacteriota bacterium]